MDSASCNVKCCTDMGAEREKGQQKTEEAPGWSLRESRKEGPPGILEGLTSWQQLPFPNCQWSDHKIISVTVRWNMKWYSVCVCVYRESCYMHKTLTVETVKSKNSLCIEKKESFPTDFIKLNRPETSQNQRFFPVWPLIYSKCLERSRNARILQYWEHLMHGLSHQ
jgi:hypothetical protein